MDNNFEWMRQNTNQRIDALRQEADLHRAKKRAAASRTPLVFPFALLRWIGRALTGLVSREHPKPLARTGYAKSEIID